MKYPVNQRVRSLMEAIGFKDEPHKFGVHLLGKGQRTEKVKNVFNDVNGISADMLALITKKIVDSQGHPVNGHWLLTGEGEMFLTEKTTPESEVVVREREELFKDLEAFRSMAVSQQETILNLTRMQIAK